MSKESAAAAAEPVADEAVDVKPGLSDEEKAALAAEDDDQAGGGTAKGDEADAADHPPQDAADADSTDDAAAGPSADALPEIRRGTAANVNLTTGRPFDAAAVNKDLADLSAFQEDLDKKYDAEEIETKDYLAQSRDVTQAASDLKADIREADFVQNANQTMAATDWQRSVNAFVDNNEEFGSAIMQGALNAALNTLYTDEANLGSSHNWYLQTAKRAVLEQITPAEAAAQNPSDADGDPNSKAVKAAKAAAEKASDAKGKLPKTLSDVPISDEAGTGKDKFADLDGLEGVELEAKLASMTTAQADEYLLAE